jgi:hypothetical protein
MSRAKKLAIRIGIGGALLLSVWILLRPGCQVLNQIARQNSLKTLGMALHSYHDEFRSFPPAVVVDENGRAMHSWRALMTLHLRDEFKGASEFRHEYRFDEPWNSESNRALQRQHWFEDVTHFVAIVGERTMWPPSGCRSIREVKDGTSNTILVVYYPQSKIHWLEPNDLHFDGSTVYALDGDKRIPVNLAGCLVLTADGMFMTLPSNTSQETISALLTIDGGEKIPNW